MTAARAHMNGPAGMTGKAIALRTAPAALHVSPLRPAIITIQAGMSTPNPVEATMGIVSEYDVDDDVQTQEELFVEFEADQEGCDRHCESLAFQKIAAQESINDSYSMGG